MTPEDSFSTESIRKDVIPQNFQTSPEVGGTISSELLNLSQASTDFQRSLLTIAEERVAIPQGKLGESLLFATKQITSFRNFIQSINTLPNPGYKRELSTGALIVPLSVKALLPSRRNEKEDLLVESYKRTHQGRGGEEIAYKYPAWMMGITEHLSLCASNQELPKAEVYLLKSSDGSIRGGATGLIVSRDEKIKKLEELKDLAGRAMGRSGNNPYQDQIDGLEGQLLGLEESLTQLFYSKLQDVSPDSLPEVNSKVGISVGAGTQAITAALHNLKEIESLLVAAFEKGKEDKSISKEFTLSLLTPSGGLKPGTLTFESESLESLTKNHALLGHFLSTYNELREFLHEVADTIGEFREIAGLRSEIGQALERPFSSHHKSGISTFNSLFRIHDDRVIDELFRLCGTTIVTRREALSREPFLEDTTTIQPLAWIIKHVLLGDVTSEESALHLLKDAPQLDASLYSSLTKIRTLLDNNDIVGLARHMDEWILNASRSNDTFVWMGPIVSLGVITRDPALAKQLKNQIPNIDLLRDLVAKVNLECQPLRGELDTIVNSCLNSFSVSLADFYQDPTMEELWEAVDRFAVFLNEPDCLRGLSGNEGMKSGIMLGGEPGVGKTYLIQCIATDLSIPINSISPEQSSDGGLIAAAKKKIEEAKAYVQKNNQGCILRIDEGESICPRRDNPTLSQEQRELTCYMLQAVNEIRRDYPRIFVMLATNYPDQVDPAMRRPGRLDIEVRMDKPDAELRAFIISDTLQKESIDLDLDQDQIAELAQITDGFIPLQLTRSIYEISRIDPLVALKRGREFKLSYETLKDKFTKEAERSVKDTFKKEG